MNEPTDILTILETAGHEIRRLRQDARSNELFLQNLVIRIAIHQIRHGVVAYKDADPVLWDKLNELATNGRLLLSSSAEVFLDLKTQLFTAEEVLAA